MIQRAALVAAVLLLFSVPRAGLRADSPEDAAQRAAEAWVSLVDSAEYAAAWAQGATRLRQMVRPSDWERTVGAERETLGRVLSRRLRSRRYTERVLGAPAGKYVILEYATVFERRSAAVETVVPVLDSDGTWRVFAFFVR